MILYWGLRSMVIKRLTSWKQLISMRNRSIYDCARFPLNINAENSPFVRFGVHSSWLHYTGHTLQGVMYDRHGNVSLVQHNKKLNLSQASKSIHFRIKFLPAHVWDLSSNSTRMYIHDIDPFSLIWMSLVRYKRKCGRLHGVKDRRLKNYQ